VRANLGRSLRRRRIFCASAVFLALAAMNVTPVLQALGAPLAVTAALFAVFDPFAAFLYIAGSQITADAPSLPLTLAQLFVACWAVTLTINGSLPHLAAIGAGMRYAIPFIIWWIVIGAINRTLDENMIYAWIVCAIACTYVPRAKGDYRGLLWMLALGTGLAVIGPWGGSLGLPVEGKVYSDAARGGFRIGAGRGDVNVAAQNLGFFIWTAVTLLLPAALAGRPGARLRGSLLILAIITVAGSAILSTGSRGGLGYLLLGALATAGSTVLLRSLSGPMFRRAALLGAAAMLALPVLWPWFVETRPGKMLLATLTFNERQARVAGGGEIAAGRAEIWSKFLAVALDHPLGGAPKGSVIDMGEYGFVALGGSGDTGHGTAHNVWLETAAMRGFPAALLFTIMFFAPGLHLIRRRGAGYAQPFVIAHTVVFLIFFNIPVANWKTFWALHGLTALAAAPRASLRLVHRPALLVTDGPA